jgi:hypothetical protein
MNGERVFLPHLELRCYRPPYCRGVAFLLAEVTNDRITAAAAQPVTMAKVEDELADLKPTFELGEKSAQMLLDQLWEAGIRPSSHEGNLGALAATQKHLEDMRRLVFEGRPQT